MKKWQVPEMMMMIDCGVGPCGGAGKVRQGSVGGAADDDGNVEEIFQKTKKIKLDAHEYIGKA